MELDTSDTDMAPAEEAHNVERSPDERAEFARRNRDRRDKTLVALENAWRLIESDPLPGARLLTYESSPEEVWRLLVKERPFLESAKLIGCSQAAKQARQLYRRAGLQYSACKDAFFDVLTSYNAKVLHGPPDDEDTPMP